MIDHSLSVEQDGGYVEPWRPTVGQRVRVRLSAECRVDWGAWTDATGHPLNMDGMTGVVDEDTPQSHVPPETQLSHSIGVVFDAEFPAEGYWFCGGYFAAGELEPLDGEP